MNFQKSGCDVEAHVKRECDSLISIVEKKKVELLKRVSDEYQEKVGELNDAMHQCEHVLLQGDGLAEFTQEALKEDNPATFLQVSVTCTVLLNVREHVWFNKASGLSQVHARNS